MRKYTNRATLLIIPLETCSDTVLLLDLTCKRHTCTFCFLPVHGNTPLIFQLPHGRDSGIREIFACGIRNPGKFNGLWNLESWALESGLQLKQSGILLTIDLFFSVLGIWNPRHRIQYSGLSWVPLHGYDSIVHLQGVNRMLLLLLLLLLLTKCT